MDQKQKKEKTEGATGLGRVTREEIEKWNQTTTLRFETGGDIRRTRRQWICFIHSKKLQYKCFEMNSKS